jgi:hypothetical protein
MGYTMDMHMMIFGLGFVIGGFTLLLIFGILSLMKRPGCRETAGEVDKKKNPFPFSPRLPILSPHKNYYSIRGKLSTIDS